MAHNSEHEDAVALPEHLTCPLRAAVDADTLGIAVLRSNVPLLLDIKDAARVLEKFLTHDVGMDKTELTMLRAALAKYDEKLKI